jgi:hypothetical protein
MLSQTGKDSVAMLRRAFPYVLIFALVLIGHALSPAAQSSDSHWVIHIAMNVVREGNLDLDEYRQAVNSDPGMAYSLTEHNGHLYSVYPPTLSILIAPLVGLLNLLSGGALHQTLLNGAAGRLEIWIASLIVAATCVVLLTVLRHWLSTLAAFVVTLVFAFGTAAWSTASRGLWQHGPTMLLLALAVLFLLDPKRSSWAGLFAGLAFAVRPTNLLSVVAFALYVAICNRRALLTYITLALGAYAPFAIITFNTFGSLQAPNYNRVGIELHPGYFEALAGHLVSPARGLLVFSPVVVIALIGAVMWLRRRDRLGITLFAVVVLHWIAMSGYSHWWAGWSYGPRYMTDMLPYLVVLSVPAVQLLIGHRAPALNAAIVLMVLLSIFFNANGALSDAAWLWNGRPRNIDTATDRLWDWRDPQFLAH